MPTRDLDILFVTPRGPGVRPQAEVPARLEGLGFGMRAVEPSAVERAMDEHRPDLVIVDLGTDAETTAAGIDQVARLARGSAAPPVLSLGGVVDDGSALLEAAAVGAADHLTGAVSDGELRARIRLAVERKLTETELRRDSAAFSRIFRSAAVGMAVVTQAGTFLRTNPALCRMIGYSAEELCGKTVREITHPDDWEDEAGVRFRELAAGSRSGYRVRKRYVHADGSTVWVRVSATSVDEPGTEGLLLLGEIEDLREQVRTREELAETQELYRQLFEHNPIPTLLVDVESLQVLAANVAAERVYGYGEGELVDMPAGELFRDPRRDTGDVATMLRSGDDIGPIQHRHLCRDGRSIDVRLVSTRLSVGGRAVRLILAQDVTERLELEERLRSAREKTAVASVAGNVAHTVNNLAVVIRGHSERLLTELSESSRLRWRVEELRRVGHQATELTRRLLTLGREAELRPRPLDLGRLLRERAETMRMLAGKGVDLELHIADEELPVRGDPQALEQVVLNLVANARDSISEQGRVVLSAARETEEREGGSEPCVRITVEDDGCGMDAAVRERVFEPFFTTKDPGEGTGLGLSEASRIVNTFGGRIRLDSTPGQGTTVQVDLPLSEPAAEEDRVDARERRILLVEDDAAVRELVREMMESAGYSVDSAASTESALEKVLNAGDGARWDLLVVDATAGEMPLDQLYRRLRARQPEIRILAISGYLDEVLATRGKLGEDVPFLSKPFSAGELNAKVRLLLAEGSSGDAD